MRTALAIYGIVVTGLFFVGFGVLAAKAPCSRRWQRPLLLIVAVGFQVSMILLASAYLDKACCV